MIVNLAGFNMFYRDNCLMIFYKNTSKILQSQYILVYLTKKFEKIIRDDSLPNLIKINQFEEGRNWFYPPTSFMNMSQRLTIMLKLVEIDSFCAPF